MDRRRIEMKNNICNRIIALVMSMIMMTFVFTSCADHPDPEITTETPQANTQAPADETTSDPRYDSKGYLKDDIPADLNYGGKTINLLVWDDVEHEEFFIAYEELGGDIVDQSIYDRNAKVESRLGVTLSFIRVKGNSENISSWNSYVNNSVSTNAKEFDILAGYSISIAKCASSGYLYNMLDKECEYLNFEQPWWSQLLLEQATFGDNLYFASGDISRNALEMMYVCYVQNGLLAQYNLQNPQEVVPSGDWTYEKFIEMCKGVYKDDGDGAKNCTKESGDVFGYVTSRIHVDPWFYGSGATICERNENGEIIESPSFTGERVANTVDMLTELLHKSNDGIFTSEVTHQDAFGQGRTLFMIERARVSHNTLAKKYGDVTFSVVPCPKYDKDQEKYITVMGNPFTLYAIASDIGDPKMASAFIECFASEGYRQVTPAVFELSLKTRYVSDSVSGVMYDLIRENVTYDVGRLFSDELIGQNNFRKAISDDQNWGSVAVQASKTLARQLVKLNQALNK